MSLRLYYLIGCLAACWCGLSVANPEPVQPGATIPASQARPEPAKPMLQPALLPSLVDVSATDQRVYLNDVLEVLPAEHTPNDPRAVLTMPGLVWQSGIASQPGTGLPAGAHWLRAALHNATDRARNYQIVVDNLSVRHADLYLVRLGDAAPESAPGAMRTPIDRIVTLYRNQGANQPYDDRPYDHHKLLASVSLAADETVLLLWRVDSLPLFHFKAQLWPAETFAGYDRQRNLLFGMLYGALAIMLFYNLFLAISVRERGYFHYVAYLFVTGLLLAADEGHLAQHLWPDSAWPRLEFATLCYALSVLSFFLFSVHFLNLRRQQRVFYQALLLVTAVTIGLIATGSLLEIPAVIRAGMAGAILLYGGALAAGIRLRLAGMASAGHYVLAILCLALGLIASNLTGPGVLHFGLGTDNYAALGTVSMLMLFSLALADRINLLLRDNRSANSGISKALEQTQRINAELVKAHDERQRLEQSMAQIREESRAKSDYLAAISHQVRTPVNSILGMAELLKESQLDNSQLHYIHGIERSGQAMVEIVSELVDFADIESGNLRLNIDPFDPETIIDDCLSILSIAAMEKRVNLIADVDPDLPLHLRGDARKVQQVLLNLLGNAVKFTERGDVIVRLRRSDRPGVNSVELCFEVIDTGVGIDSELIDQLFTPFTARDRSGNSGHGTGLGLPISKQLVELMDGRIGVESTPGEGSRFWFTVRCLAVKNVEEVRERPFAGRRILLVEAHPVLSDSLARTLTGWGAQVTAVTDAESAEQTLTRSEEQAQPFNVAIIDHQLPSGSGLALAAEIAASDLATPPIMLLTSVTEAISNAELSTSGIEMVLEKPITHHQLEDALAQTLGLNHRKRENLAGELPLRGMRVLVAEDNSVNQMVIAATLHRLGVEPILVADGLAAVEAAQDQALDAVLMDCEMPELDGYQASRQIRNRERRENLPPLPIIALSAHTTSDHQTRARDAGIDNYLTKPVTRQSLETALRSVYRKHRQDQPDPADH